LAFNYTNIAGVYSERGLKKEALEHLTLALKLQEETGNKSGIALSYSAMADVYNTMGNRDEALTWSLKSLKLSEEINDKKSIALSLSRVGRVYNEMGRNTEAINYYLRCLKLNVELEDKQATAYAHGNIAHFYQNKAKYKDALEHYQLCLKLLEEMNDPSGIAQTLNNIAIIYKEQGMIAEALANYKHALELYEKIKDKKGAGLVLNSVANTYYEQATSEMIPAVKFKKMEEATGLNKRALKLQEEVGDKNGIATSLNQLANIYAQQEKTDSALLNYQRGLLLFREIKEKEGVAITLSRLTDLMHSSGNESAALKYGLEGLKISKELGEPTIIRDVSKTLSDIYQKQQQPKQALEMFELYIQMRDSIASEENKKAGIKNQLKYEYEKRSAADSVKNVELQKVKDAQLSAQNATLKQEKFQRYSLVVGLLIVLAGLGFVINRFRITSKQKKIIEEQKITVDSAFEKLHEKNKEVLDSIRYAKRIQSALMPNEKYIQRNLILLKGAVEKNN
ncbi:MAG: tetratricopeptide repeat protein, partial [Bacteroidia bacterium]|nr:tetratricopeptide repeat protein [Bacteroidia bacterium]